MKHDEHHSERGQILVMVAGALVALLVIAALVVDLGFAFMLRRQTQNAADPGAIAAARFIKATGSVADMRAAACIYARENGFFSTDATCTNETVAPFTRLDIHYPPSATAGRFAGRPGYVEVVVGRRHDSFLAGIVGQREFTVSSSAVGAFSNGESNSSSLIALNRGDCGGNAAGAISGGGTVRISSTAIDPLTGLPYNGGYVHVNSSCGVTSDENGICQTGSGSNALRIDGGSRLEAPEVYVHGTCGLNGSGATVTTSQLTEGAVQLGDPLADLPKPKIATMPPGTPCIPSRPEAPTGPGAGTCNISGHVTVQPGVYYGGWKIDNGSTLELAPGIYYIAGGGIDLTTGGALTSVSSVSGTPDPAPILIFSSDNPVNPTGAAGQQGVIKFRGGEVHLRGMASGAWKGILIWQDGHGTNPTAQVEITGTAVLNIAGTIYAPKAEVKVAGSGSAVGYAAIQIIADKFDVGGTGTILMPYDPNQIYQFPEKGLVR
jgi:hypothetical protein